jgi:hypothetical protein
MQIDQTECQTDKIKTDAILRGVRVIDYNAQINELQNDLEQLRALNKKHNIKDVKGTTELMNKLEIMETQVIDWVKQAGFKLASQDYAITILVEQIKT